MSASSSSASSSYTAEVIDVSRDLIGITRQLDEIANTAKGDEKLHVKLEDTIWQLIVCIEKLNTATRLSGSGR